MGCCPCKCGDKGTNGIAHIKRQGRGCTDILVLLGFLLSFGILAFILMEAQKLGADPNRIIMPTNMKGEICGMSAAVKDQPYGAFPNPWGTENYKAMVCVKDCEQTNNPKNDKMSSLHVSSKLLYYCIPVLGKNMSINIQLTGEFNSEFMNTAEQLSRAVGDVWAWKELMLGSVGIAIAVTFFFCSFLRCCAKTLVYSLLLLIMTFGLMLSQLMLDFAMEAQIAKTYSAQNIQYMQYAGYTIMALTGVFGLALFFLRQQIDIGIEVTREAARALLDMKCLVFFPIIPCLIALTYAAFWAWVAANIYSCAEQTSEPTPDGINKYDFTWLDTLYPSKYGTVNPYVSDTYQQSTISENIRYAMLYHVFHFFWVTQFFYYFGYLTFAGAAADWYFTATDDRGEKKRGNDEDALGMSPVAASCGRTFRYHMGTVAVCALIIAIVKTVRAVVTYIEAQTKGQPPNQAQKAVFCMIQCCLKCLECCLDKINKYSLVWTAVYGDGFCHSVCSSFALVWRNLFRVAAINVVANTIFLMGKISIGMITSGIVILIIKFYDTSVETVSPLGPALFTFASSYVVAALFFIIFSATIDTLFICFLIDSEVNEKGHMMASEALQKLVGKYEKHSKAEAHNTHKTRLARGASQVDGFHNLDNEMEMDEMSSKK